MALGLALGAGGARGWCHVGVLRVLDDLGIAPDMVAGSSMGALVGAAWAAGKLDALEDWGKSLTPIKVLGQLDPRLREGGMLGGRAIADLLSQIGLPDRIEDLEKPFIAVATDMHTGREVWLREGKLLDAVRASVAIPGVLSPHQVDGCWMLDGGLINPVPVAAARALGARKIISVNPNEKHGAPLWTGERVDDASDLNPSWMAGLPDAAQALLRRSEDKTAKPGYFDVVSVTVDVLTEFVRKVREAADPADLTLSADLGHMSVLEFYRAREAMADGHRFASEAQDTLLALARAAQ